MAKPPASDSLEAAGLAPEPDEIGPTVQDVARNLAHDLSDTPDDLRDAAAAAPLIIVKLAQRFAGAVTARPGAVAILAGLVAVLWIGQRGRRHRRRR